MNDIPISYRNLYALLLSLGFQERVSSQAVAQPRVFFHEPTDTILAFGRETDEQVTAADMLSTEVHLQAKGIVDQPLESLVGVSPVKR